MYQTNKIEKSRCRRASAPVAAAIGLAIAMFLSPSGAFALIINFPSWEVASEFNDASNPDGLINPSGVWSYGEKPSTFGFFSYLSVPFNFGTFPDTSGWTNANGYPDVFHNVHTIPITVSNGTYSNNLPPRALILHPGLSGQYAVVRFTALFKGTYKLSGQFYALDDNGGGTTTDVWIVKNNGTPALFSGTVNYPSNVKFASFTSKTVTLKTGDYLDFEVGFGSNGNNNFDSTGLNAVIEKIK